MTVGRRNALFFGKIGGEGRGERAFGGTAGPSAGEQGLPSIPIRVEEVSASTSSPNAESVGLGPTRRIDLWDTLLDGRFAKV